uniref:Uncharacterized protein n=1 Tax=Mycena chlorophos TaxID=658473 RepID=A0ABQ0LGS9_MYCCL|nr:predicted protein [Mycena chlorophos]
MEVESSESVPPPYDATRVSAGATHTDDLWIKFVVRSATIQVPETPQGAKQLLTFLEARGERYKSEKGAAQKRLNELLQYIALVRNQLHKAQGDFAEASADLERAKQLLAERGLAEHGRAL